MSDNIKYRLQTCYHCGNKGLLKVEHIHRHKHGGPIFDSSGNMVDVELLEIFEWYMLSCPVCNKISLIEEYNDDCIMDFGPFIETLYPQSTIDFTGVPQNIKTAFESALRVKNIDTAICAIALRRVLEAICKDRGAEGNNLEAMINDMIDRGFLPQMFDDACWIIRQLGNSAAHGDNKTFSSRHIEQTIDFMQNIILYLYALPIKIEELRETIETEKIRVLVNHFRDINF